MPVRDFYESNVSSILVCSTVAAIKGIWGVGLCKASHDSPGVGEDSGVFGAVVGEEITVGGTTVVCR